MDSTKISQNTECDPGTLLIDQQIVLGTIVAKALSNEFGLVNLNGENIAYFNYNGIYSNFNFGDMLFFFLTKKSNVVINLGNVIKQYPSGVDKLAFNLHTPKKSLSKDSGPQKKGTKPNLPPASKPLNYFGSASEFTYIFNDCGDILVMEANSNMTLAWERCTLSVVSSSSIPIVYGYAGIDSAVWIP